MRLTRMQILNNGQIEHLDFSPSFNENGEPLPTIIVGENGSGKTNLLSIIADAIFELSTSAYENALPSQGLSGRAYFRVSGGKLVTFGKNGYATALNFEADGQIGHFVERHGEIDEDTIKRFFTEENGKNLLGLSGKNTSYSDEKSKEIFKNNVFSFFPASRSEEPYWLNSSVSESASFATYERYSNKIYEPIYIEKSLVSITQWLLGVLLDGRGDIAFNQGPTGQTPILVQPVENILIAQKRWNAANRILQIILSDNRARFVWFGRRNPSKIGIQVGDSLRAVGLNALCNGQASLLSIFGTLLMYADMRVEDDGDPFSVPGICIVDEIDAHMHVNLQTDAIPSLLGLFPNIQFFVSGHSPLFLMGIERRFPSNRFLELPEGQLVPSEGYREFEAAFSAFKASSAFSAAVRSSAESESDPVVWLAGETDPIYFERAAEILGYNELYGKNLFRWIGGNDSKGQGFFTGDDSLKRAGALFKANPEVLSQSTLLLFDSDAPQQPYSQGNLHIRSIHKNNNNNKVEIGIENLLPESWFDEKFYETRSKARKDGGESIVTSLRKMMLCTNFCEKARKEDFHEFDVELKSIRELLF